MPPTWFTRDVMFISSFIRSSVANAYLSGTGDRERPQRCWTRQASAGHIDGGGDLSRRPFHTALTY